MGYTLKQYTDSNPAARGKFPNVVEYKFTDRNAKGLGSSSDNRNSVFLILPDKVGGEVMRSTTAHLIFPNRACDYTRKERNDNHDVQFLFTHLYGEYDEDTVLSDLVFILINDRRELIGHGNKDFDEFVSKYEEAFKVRGGKLFGEIYDLVKDNEFIAETNKSKLIPQVNKILQQKGLALFSYIKLAHMFIYDAFNTCFDETDYSREFLRDKVNYATHLIVKTLGEEVERVVETIDNIIYDEVDTAVQSSKTKDAGVTFEDEEIRDLIQHFTKEFYTNFVGKIDPSRNVETYIRAIISVKMKYVVYGKFVKNAFDKGPADAQDLNPDN